MKTKMTIEIEVCDDRGHIIYLILGVKSECEYCYHDRYIHSAWASKEDAESHILKMKEALNTAYKNYPSAVTIKQELERDRQLHDYMMVFWDKDFDCQKDKITDYEYIIEEVKLMYGEHQKTFGAGHYHPCDREAAELLLADKVKRNESV